MPVTRNSRAYNGAGPNAVVLVDYTNVYRSIEDTFGESEQTDARILGLIAQIQKYATEQLSLRTVRTVAFAAIPPGGNGGLRCLGAWLSNGIEQKLSYAAVDTNATAIELTLEASSILSRSPEVSAFIILSGDRWFVPLAQELQRHGRFVLVACLDTPAGSEELPADVVDSFFNARYLIEASDRFGSGDNGSSFRNDDYEEEETSEGRRPETVVAIEDPIARQSLDIIESYFGKYQEVYLTPLLRKLTEHLEHEDEPKSVINHLEECGAVWLEKRHGFPHNYTVLMVNPDHPDVQEAKEGFELSEPEKDEYYPEDSYANGEADESEFGDVLD